MSIAQRIHALLEQDPSAHPSSIATELAVSEWEVVRHLPAELMTRPASTKRMSSSTTVVGASSRRVFT